MIRIITYLCSIFLLSLLAVPIIAQDNCHAEIEIASRDNGFVLEVAAKGQEPFSYVWSTGSTEARIEVSEAIEYCVKVTDANGCVAEDCIVPRNTNAECKVNIKREKIDGGYALTIDPRPSDLVEEISWNTESNDPTIRVFKDGEYCVKVSFSNGCVASKCVKINIPGNDRCRMEIGKELVDNGIKLTAHLSPETNSSPVLVVWSTGDTARSIVVTERAKYCAVAYFGNDCTAEDCINLKDEDRCKVEIIAEETDEGIKLTARTQAVSSTDQAPTFKWSTGETTQSILVTERDKYCVVAYYGDYCKAEDCINLNRNTDCSVEIMKRETATGIVLLAKVRPENVAVRYLWSTGDTTEVIRLDSNLTEYCVKISTANGCEASDCIKLRETDRCAVEIVRDSSDTGIKLTARIKSNLPDSVKVTFKWSTGDSTQSIVVDERARYCVVAYFGDACKAEDCINLRGTDVCKVRIQKRRTDEGLVLIAKATPANQDYRYTWSTGATTQSIRVDSAGEYCVKIVGANGCEARTCEIIETDDRPCSITFSRVMTDAGLKVTVKARPADQLEDLFWNTGDTTRSILITEPGEYCVEALFSNGCEAKECFEIDDLNSTCNVEIYPRRTDGGIKLHAVAKPAGLIDSIKWSTGSDDKSITVTESGEYCVVAYFSNGCRADRCVNINIPGETDSCRAIIRVLNDQMLQAKSKGQAPFEYQWNTGEITKNIKIQEAGEYCVTITDANGCQSNSCVEIESLNELETPHNGANKELQSNKSKSKNATENSFVLLETNPGQPTLKISPNPVKQQLNFRMDIPYTDEYYITITDMQGTNYLQQTIHWLKGASNGRILVSDLPEGMYILNIRSSQILMTKRFIKH